MSFSGVNLCMRKCRVCQIEKELIEFPRNRRQCVVCFRAEAKARRDKNKSSPDFLAKWRTQQMGYRKAKPANTIFLAAKARAKKNGLDFSIGLEDVLIPEKCPVLGNTLELGAKRAGPNSPTLDRIDNSKGYIKGNVKVISWRANALKNNATIGEIENLLSYMRKELTTG